MQTGTSDLSDTGMERSILEVGRSKVKVKVTQCQNSLQKSLSARYLQNYPRNFNLTWQASPLDKIQDRDAGQQMSAGPMAPPYLAELCRPVVHLIQDVDTRGQPPPANLMCNKQPQPLVAGTLLFPVRRLGTVYQLNCVCRHCWRPPSHDAWKCISSSALNDMCLQRVWFYLRLRCL